MPLNQGLLRPHYPKLTLIYLIIDMSTIVASLALILAGHELVWQDRYSFAVLVILFFFLFFARRNHIYQSWRTESVNQELLQLWLSWIGAAFGLLLLVFMFKTSTDYSRAVVLTWLVLTPVLLSLWRIIIRAALYYLRSMGYNTRQVAIVGVNDSGLRLAQMIQTERWMGFNLVGFYDDRDPNSGRMDSYTHEEIRGSFEALIDSVHHGQIDRVYITLPMCAGLRVNQLIERLKETRISLYYVPDLFSFNLLQNQRQRG